MKSNYRPSEMPFEREAIQGKPPMDDISEVDTAFYEACSIVYAAFHRSSLNRTEAQKTIEALRLIYYFYNQSASSEKRNADLWKRIETAVTVYAKESTVSNADKIIEIIYNLGNNWRNEFVRRAVNE